MRAKRPINFCMGYKWGICKEGTVPQCAINGGVGVGVQLTKDRTQRRKEVSEKKGKMSASGFRSVCCALPFYLQEV